MSEDTENLFPPDGPKWAVITCTRRQTKQEIALKTPKIIAKEHTTPRNEA